MKELLIQSSQGAYPVRFFADIPALLAEIAKVPRTLLLIDRNVAHAYGPVLAGLMGQVPTCEVHATEDEKTLEGCARVLSFMQQHNATRQTVLLVMGGGIVQDIATLCAHLYYRGVAWHYFPTTLLGMADSCIGAKASINFNKFKNQLGVFHSPASVGICPDFVATLPDTEVRSGWGEIVKLHLAGSAAHFARVTAVLDREGWRSRNLIDLIFASLQVKKDVIEVDEFDNGIRRTLNYGHTFGHALEAITDHGIPHGLAVAWGMDLVNFLARERGLLAPEGYAAIHRLLAAHFPWKLSRPVTVEQLLDATKRDKKLRDGKLNLVLLRQPGQLVIEPQDYDTGLATHLHTYLTKHSIVTW